ncbi:MAG: hypothetical protein AB1432_12745 [Bacteroidota bacterium]
MMKKLDDVIKNNFHGLHYGNRVLLPFGADILKAVIENDIITDFSSSKSGASYKVNEDFTEIYFYDYEILSEVVNRFEKIKLIVVERGRDIFDFSNHRKIALSIEEKHKIFISEINDDTLLFKE